MKRSKKKNSNYVEPYNLTRQEMVDLNCPLRNILRIEKMHEKVFFIRSIIKDLITNTMIKTTIRNIEACALIFINLSNCCDIYGGDVKFGSVEEKAFYNNNINLTDDIIVQLCVSTSEQHASEDWHNARKLRISASSKAHRIKSRWRKQSCDLANDFLCENNQKTSKSVKYGITHENKAIKDYSKEKNSIVVKIGLFVMPKQPWLCASADGVVIEEDFVSKILEVKCPYSCADNPVFDNKTKKFNVPYLFTECNSTYLRESHQYYTQTQLIMYVTGTMNWDFYVWSTCGSTLVNIPRNEVFLKKLLPQLNDFYFNFFVPAALKSSEENLSNDINRDNEK